MFDYKFFSSYLIDKLNIINLQPFRKEKPWNLGYKYFTARDGKGNRYFIKIGGPPELTKREFMAAKKFYAIQRNNNYSPEVIHYNNHINLLIFEYLEGNTLEIILDNFVDYSNSIKISLLNQFIDIIELLHKINVVHRDIRPDNIIIQQTNKKNIQVYLIDFGFMVGLENGIFPELNLVKKEIIPVRYLGKDYKPSALVWDDAYSFKKILNQIDIKWKEIFPAEWKKLNSLINKKIYALKKE